MRKKPTNRLIEVVVHSLTGERLTTNGDWLENMPEDEFSRWRRQAVSERGTWACLKCDHSVFPSRHPVSGLRYFRHFPGAPDSCPWHNDDAFDLKQLDTLRFGGKGEGVKHKDVKKFLRYITEIDERFSPPPEIERYSPYKEHRIVRADGQRQPDVYRYYLGAPIAFEAQLSNTYLRVIQGREDFYKNHGFRLIWVFWDFETTRDRLNSQDIYHPNKSNALSLDTQVVNYSIETRALHFRAWWWDFAVSSAGQIDRVWRNQIVNVSELEWDWQTGLPFFIDMAARKVTTEAEAAAICLRREEAKRQEGAALETARKQRKEALRDQIIDLWTSGRVSRFDNKEIQGWSEIVAEGWCLNVCLPPDLNSAHEFKLSMAILCSAKSGKTVNYDFGDNLVRLAHQVAQSHKHLLLPFGFALKVYGNEELINSQDVKETWARRRKTIRTEIEDLKRREAEEKKVDEKSPFRQPLAHAETLRFLFPEIKDKIIG